MIGDERVTSAYSQNAEFWVNIVRNRLDPYQTQLTDPSLLEMVGDVEDLEILDAGCGEGYLSRELALRDAKHVHGVDTCEELLDAARSHPDHLPERVTFHHADVAALPLPDNSVDLVIANRLPNGIAEPTRRFEEFARVLRPSGRAILLGMHPCFYVERTANGTFDLDSYFGIRIVEKKFNVEGLVSPAASVQQFYSLEAYVGMITAAGFAITSLREPHPSRDERRSNSWWDDHFDRPMFLLLECVPR